MAEKPTPPRVLSSMHAPDPATSYERAKPEKEAGMGRLDNNVFKAEECEDKMEHAVSHKQSLRQINADDVVNERAGHPAQGASLNSHPSEASPKNRP